MFRMDTQRLYNSHQSRGVTILIMFRMDTQRLYNSHQSARVTHIVVDHANNWLLSSGRDYYALCINLVLLKSLRNS